MPHELRFHEFFFYYPDYSMFFTHFSLSNQNYVRKIGFVTDDLKTNHGTARVVLFTFHSISTFIKAMIFIEIALFSLHKILILTRDFTSFSLSPLASCLRPAPFLSEEKPKHHLPLIHYESS